MVFIMNAGYCGNKRISENSDVNISYDFYYDLYVQWCDLYYSTEYNFERMTHF